MSTPAEKKKPLIALKGKTLPVVSVTLRSLNPEQLIESADSLLSKNRLFDGYPAMLDLSQLGDEPEADWAQIKEIFKQHGLHVIGVLGGKDELLQDAAAANLPSFAGVERSLARPEPEEAPEVAPVAEAPPPATEAAPVPTMVLDRPLRSGQQIYARGGDLVVLAAVNAGAEVIADGSIHIYAPLRGRALAGANGDTGARIFTTRFEAELVSIAGVYRTFETGVPMELAGKPVQVKLIESAAATTEGQAEATSKLSIDLLQTS